ncbi:stearoyl-CoA desaturase 5-like [Antedon mediterranea]|uniref:stearoyl-CoA desaturase 5-like n=1 Tax=Antedon mediterranea TaxID=105859 RepID=UPI003AF58C6D
MAPHPNEHVLNPKIVGLQEEIQSLEDQQSQIDEEIKPRTYKVVLPNVIGMSLFHAGAVYALLFVVWKCHLMTILWASFVYFWSETGITAGSHRLWAHRSYKAKWPLRLLLAVLTLTAHQNSVFEWSRDHRVHHKFSETDSDPHNAKRGFFFSHVGWLLVKKHPDVIKDGQKIDLSDLKSDPIVQYQHKYYTILMPLFCFIIPSITPTLWGEYLWNGLFVCGILRYVVSLNFTWLVNSAAHLWGNKPYDKYINPAENIFVAGVTFGEGWHNYHHTFPQDYRAGELGWRVNPTSMFIDFMAKIGLAYDLKTVSPAVIEARIQRTGDVGLRKCMNKQD